MALCHSPLSILLTSVCFPFSLSLFSVGCHLLQLKRKKNIVRLHSSSPLLNSVVVTLDDKGVKRKSPSHYILFLFYFVFLFTVVYLGIWLFFFFFIASNTSSSSLHFFFFYFNVCIWFSHMMLRGKVGGRV